MSREAELRELLEWIDGRLLRMLSAGSDPGRLETQDIRLLDRARQLVLIELDRCAEHDS